MRDTRRHEGADWGSLSVPSVLAAAHELKAPLVLMRQLSYQLEASERLSRSGRLTQERLRLTSERALRLVENVTKAQRLEDGLFSLEPLQTTAVWQTVVEELSPLAEHMGQRFELAVPKKPRLVVAHRELLPAVLTGLCDNALAHNPSGAHVRLSVNEHRGDVVFSVRDHGPKLDAAAFRDLENRLGSSPQPLGARPASSGLGLWIAGAFARAMLSRLSVIRHRSGGMTFNLHVPMSKQLSLL